MQEIDMDWNNHCAYCRGFLEGEQAVFELPRYKPSIPRRLCITCSKNHLKFSELINELILKEEKECSLG